MERVSVEPDPVGRGPGVGESVEEYVDERVDLDDAIAWPSVPVLRPDAVGCSARACAIAERALAESAALRFSLTATVPQRRVVRFGFAMTIGDATDETCDRPMAASSEPLRRDADAANATARVAPRDCWDGRNCVERTVIGIPYETR